MGRQQRQVQHRPDREKARGRELSEALKEIKQLKRLVSRQQKTISKLEERLGTPVELEEASPEPTRRDPQPVIIVEKPDADRCNCGGVLLVVFTTPGGKVIKGCKNCKARL